MISMRSLKIFLASYPLFVLIDFIWFGFIISTCYHAHIGHLMRADDGLNASMFVALLAALALIVMGAVIFVTPLVERASYQVSFFWGALYGLCIYGGYSLSNYAYFRGWPLFITGLDTAWGIVACGLLGVFISYLSKKVFSR